MKYLAFISILFFFVACNQNDKLVLYGTINENLISTFNLTQKDNQFEGYFFYDDGVDSIKVKGFLENENLILNEYDDKLNLTGTFKGTFVENNYIGYWNAPNSNKKVKFNFSSNTIANNTSGITNTDSVNNNNSSINSNNFNVKIDSVKIKKEYFKDICLIREDSYYPRLSGIQDETFQKEVNALLKFKVDSFINEEKKSAKCDEQIEEIEVEEWGTINPMSQIIECWYDVLPNNNYISIVQTYFGHFYFGNAHYVLSSVVNIDVNHHQIISNNDFRNSFKDIKKINEVIKNYFDSQFRDELDSSFEYPKININDLTSYKFGLRNDSILLITEQWTTSHETYFIPLCKFEH